MPIPSTIFFIFIITGWSVSLVASGVSNQPYLSRNAPIAFIPSDSLDTRSDTVPYAAALARLLPAIPVKPAGIDIIPVAAIPFAANIVPAVSEPK